ncbi:MAG: glycine-rich domain-containing protein [Gluconobacter sp.]|uniref:glycine-rich domain-containing protein n=1 Tax=Gluconobacter sp. TaxID=1876758 RepID=UPI0039E807FC
MKASDFSPNFPIVFASQAQDAYVRTVPQTADTEGQASLAIGFPPVTFVQIGSGGMGPDGRDLQGILRMLSSTGQRYETGCIPAFSASLASAVGGYPLNAIVMDTSVVGLYWYSTADSNTTTPGATGASWRAIVLDQSLLGWTQIGASQYLTAPSWARYLEVIQIGGGGGGAGCQGTSDTQSISGAGGAAGGILHTRHLLTGITSIAQYIGAGGDGSSGGISGHKGGDTYIVLNGTTAATAGGGSGGNTYQPGGSSGGDGGANTLISGALIGSYAGSDGSDGQIGSHLFIGSGAPGYLGAGAGRAGSGAGQAATSPGAGGGGAYDTSLSGTAYAGGTGAAGACLYRWLP